MDDVASDLLPLAGIFVDLGAALEFVFATDDKVTFVGIEFRIGVGLPIGKWLGNYGCLLLFLLLLRPLSFLVHV